jgi:hypothetical protein
VAALEAMNVELPPRPGRRNSQINEMYGLFKGAGLQQVASRTIEIEVSYTNFDDYWTAQTGLANDVVQAIREMSEPDVARGANVISMRQPVEQSHHWEIDFQLSDRASIDVECV